MEFAIAGLQYYYCSTTTTVLAALRSMYCQVCSSAPHSLQRRSNASCKAQPAGTAAVHGHSQHKLIGSVAARGAGR